VRRRIHACHMRRRIHPKPFRHPSLCFRWTQRERGKSSLLTL